jgi:coproporphyrinogen III oxidase-like Fe-S oxidoreductase
VAALAAGRLPERELEELPPDVRAAERVMLGLRLDEPLALDGLESALDAAELSRLVGLGLVARARSAIALTPRGRLLGGAVTARLLA